MKVLLLCYRGNPFCGGQGIYVYHLSRELARLGIEVDVMVGPPYPEPLDEWATVYKIENLNLWSVHTKDIPGDSLSRIFKPFHFLDYLLTRFHIFPEMETFSLRAFVQLRRILRNKKYDIIHDVNTLGWGLIPMKGYGIPIVSTIHHPLTRDQQADFAINFDFWQKLTTILFYPIIMQRIVINRIDRVITSFKEGVSELNRAFGVKPEKVSVVYNGMDTDLFRNSGVPRQENSLLFVGNTEDQKKGFRFLLEALAMLPEKVKLTIVDDGPPNKLEATKLAKKLGVEHRITITGKVPVSRLIDLYSSATLLVMSSLYEGFGLPAAEAMACNTPVVTTTAGALAEIVIPETGITVPPENPAALRDAINELLADPARRKKMGPAGRKWVETNFSWPVAAANTLDVYRDIIESYRRKS